MHSDHCIEAVRWRAETPAITLSRILDDLAMSLALASTYKSFSSGWSDVLSEEEQVEDHIINKAILRQRAHESRLLCMGTTRACVGGIRTGLQAPVDITLPYAANTAGNGRAAASTDTRDGRSGSQGARDRSIYPACGSGVTGAVAGARRGDRGASGYPSCTGATS